ncbi:MAG TPA: redox-sensing transcriptional repressor Rex [Herbinix luporum]|nr:redox-sensing transcriptional repressor Rex [Herbinix luporum]HHT56521.1 redox-sensing transcriptional repressor Rex [Herbinix luporum]
MEQKCISPVTLKRLPTYLSYLKSLPEDASSYISATAIANALQMGDVQVRKDLAAVSDKGKPKVGYKVKDLINELETYLGCNKMEDVVLVGAGKLGKVLLNYKGFEEYGINIAAAFDINDSVISDTNIPKPIYHLSKLTDLCSETKIHMGILTVPVENAQSACDYMIQCGIRAIMNFTPTPLKVPGNVLIQNVNIAASLALLSKQLSEQTYNMM